MGIGAVSGDGCIPRSLDATEADGAAGALSPEALAEVLVEASRREREAMRTAADAIAEAVRSLRERTAAEMRSAAADRLGSAVGQAIVGAVSAALQGAAAATEAGDGDDLALAGTALGRAGPLLDFADRAADEHDLRAAEHRETAESLGEWVQRTRAAADASRAEAGRAIEGAARLADSLDRGVRIAIGRE